jgi:hypothetical protein
MKGSRGFKIDFYGIKLWSFLSLLCCLCSEAGERESTLISGSSGVRPCSGKLFPRSNSSVIPEVRLSSVFCRSQLSALHSYFKYKASSFSTVDCVLSCDVEKCCFVDIWGQVYGSWGVCMIMTKVAIKRICAAQESEIWEIWSLEAHRLAI